MYSFPKADPWMDFLKNDKKEFKKVDFLICLKYIIHMDDY